ncbi:RNA-binding protein [Pedobacter sp. SYSU D00535]|uniref:RNA recognition motif domain-containing protein n=1 Tax=Pedobacter sp. SYSU D00535 TaxID=2810308 RepID=UPI001A956ED2|nr:RNA-binding protein [Pedobacter sp. SYSU D00535]
MKIFIKNLPLQVEEKELREVFGDFGVVKSLRIIKDKETGASRGFGFVEMPDEAQAKEAIRNMNGGDYYGNKIFVTEARDDDNGGGGANRGGFKGGAPRGNTRRF